MSRMKRGWEVVTSSGRTPWLAVAPTQMPSRWRHWGATAGCMLLLDVAVLLLSITAGGPKIPVVAFWLIAGNCYALCLLAGSLLQQPRVRRRQPRQRLESAPMLTFEAFGGPCDGKRMTLRATEQPPDSILVRNPGIHWMHRSRYDRVTGSEEPLSAGDVVEGQAVRLVRRYHYHGVADRLL